MDGWAPLFDASCTLEELEQIIAEQTARSIQAFSDQLASDPELAFVTEKGRAYAVAKATPVIAAQTRTALTSGWVRLKAEAAGIVQQDVP